MNTLNSIFENPEISGKITLNVGANDLLFFANTLAEKFKTEPAPPEKPDTYYTQDEAAERLKVTRVTLWQWRKKGILAPRKIGNVLRYKESDIKQALDSRA